MKKVVLLLAILLALNSCKEDSVIIKSADNNISKREVILSQEVGKDSTTHITTQIIWCNNEILNKSETKVKTKNLPKVSDTVDYQSGKKKVIEKQQKFPIFISIK